MGVPVQQQEVLAARDKLVIMALLCAEAISCSTITEIIDDAEERRAELRSEVNRKRDDAYGKRRKCGGWLWTRALLQV